jgi:hypothetical protein
MVSVIELGTARYEVKNFIESKDFPVYDGWQNELQYTGITNGITPYKDEKNNLVSLVVACSTDEPFEFAVDGTKVQVEPATGLHFYRFGDKLSFKVICFPL